MELENILIIALTIILIIWYFTQPNTKNQEHFSPENQINGYQFIGCYNDKFSSPAISNKIGKVNNITDCINKANNAKNDIVGYHSGDVCYSGSSTSSKYDKYGTANATTCNLNSIGDNSMLVYKKMPIVSSPVIEEKLCSKQECPKQEMHLCPKQECPICETCKTYQTLPVCSESISSNYTIFYIIIGILCMLLLGTCILFFSSEPVKNNQELQNLHPITSTTEEK